MRNLIEHPLMVADFQLSCGPSEETKGLEVLKQRTLLRTAICCQGGPEFLTQGAGQATPVKERMQRRQLRLQPTP